MADGCLIRRNPIGHVIRDLIETGCYLQLTFSSVTQAFDPVMDGFDLGDLTNNKLLS